MCVNHNSVFVWITLFLLPILPAGQILEECYKFTGGYLANLNAYYLQKEVKNKRVMKCNCHHSKLLLIKKKNRYYL